MLQRKDANDYIVSSICEAGLANRTLYLPSLRCRELREAYTLDKPPTSHMSHLYAPSRTDDILMKT